jgi:hypothetical protein
MGGGGVCYWEKRGLGEKKEKRGTLKKEDVGCLRWWRPVLCRFDQRIRSKE